MQNVQQKFPASSHMPCKELNSSINIIKLNYKLDVTDHKYWKITKMLSNKKWRLYFLRILKAQFLVSMKPLDCVQNNLHLSDQELCLGACDWVPLQVTNAFINW